MRKVDSGMEVSLFSSSEQSFLLSVICTDFLKLPEVVTFGSSWMGKPFFCSTFTCVRRGLTLDQSSNNLVSKKPQTCHKSLLLQITRKDFVGQEATVWELLCQGLILMKKKRTISPLSPPAPPWHWIFSALMWGIIAWSWNSIQAEMWLYLRLNILLSLNLWKNAYCLYQCWYHPSKQPKQCKFILRKQYKHTNLEQRKRTELPLARQISFAKDKTITLYPIMATEQPVSSHYTGHHLSACHINSPDEPESRYCGLWSGAVVMGNMQKDEWIVPQMTSWKGHTKGFLVRIS